ncbi:MAG TPA: hypothetical protein VEK56_13825 [Vicinamibacterales bacterium]|nr:hypothetical protein [Vicinamibacterales bacterium]
MTAVREAVALPMMFLTVVATAAIRPGANGSIVPPSLASLVGSVALLALLVRSGTVAPAQLVNQRRSMLANLNGLSVLLTMFFASAQLLTALVPESGVPALVAWCVLVSLVMQAFAIAPDRTRLLRGLLVMFGAAFALKFIVLAAISAPAESRITRALQVLFEGITLGAVTQRATHPLEGYFAFGAGALYLIAIWLLPPASWRMIRVSQIELPASSVEVTRES